MVCKVQNRNGTEQNEPPVGYESWIDVWKDRKRNPNLYCAFQGCERMAIDGSHVNKVETKDEPWYIVPLCPAPNMCTEPFGWTVFVSYKFANDNE